MPNNTLTAMQAIQLKKKPRNDASGWPAWAKKRAAHRAALSALLRTLSYRFFFAVFFLVAFLLVVFFLATFFLVFFFLTAIAVLPGGYKQILKNFRFLMLPCQRF
jgi:hypothetical protein